MDTYVKAGICTGYGLGVNCIACCHQHRKCNEVYHLIETPIRIKLDNCRYAMEADGKTYKKWAYISMPMPPFCSPIDSFAVGIDGVDETFEQDLAKFMAIIEKNTKAFDAELKKGTPLEEIAKGKGFIGQINGKIGCLLYPHEKKDKFYRPELCADYLCGFAGLEKQQKHFPAFESIMKRFIKGNLENDKFNSFSFSRLIHIMGEHRNMPGRFGITGMHKHFTEENADEIIKGLNQVLEIVTR